jgi:hypothetical protein
MNKIGSTSSHYPAFKKSASSSDASASKSPPSNFVSLPVTVAGPGKMEGIPDKTVKLFVETLADGKGALMVESDSGDNQGIDAPVVPPLEANQTKTASAAELLKDFLEMSPEERIRANVLNNMGMTQEGYKHLPFDEKAKSDEQVSLKLKADQKHDSLNDFDPIQQAIALQKTAAGLYQPISTAPRNQPGSATYLNEQA